MGLFGRKLSSAMVVAACDVLVTESALKLTDLKTSLSRIPTGGNLIIVLRSVLSEEVS